MIVIFTLGVALNESFGVAPRVKSLAGLSDGSLPGLQDKMIKIY